MIAVITNLYTRGTEFKDLDGSDYIGYYHVNNSGSIMSESDYVPGVSKQLILSNASPETPAGDIISRYNDDTDTFEGDYVIIPVKNYKNDIDLPIETVLLEDPSPVTITDQPDIFFKRIVDNVTTPGADVFIDESNTIRVVRGALVTLQFGYESGDAESNITFQWFDSFNRIISTDPILTIDTANVDPQEETYYCTVTDSFGSDTTNEITISILDDSNPYIFKNVLKNGSGNSSTSDWESIGSNPEEVGNFLHTWVVSVDTFGIPTNGAGTYYYHKIDTSWDNTQVNQWYPRPEIFDSQNGFGGSIVDEIKENYFRAGVFNPIVKLGENDYSGVNKSSVQVIDLTEIENLIDGKVYGMAGLKAVLFGWVGTRADQADYGDCYFEFLDENDSVMYTDGNKTISSLRHWDRIINEYPRESWTIPVESKIFSGLYDSASNYQYMGILNDQNVGVLYDRYHKNIYRADGSVDQIRPIVKTCIIGRSTDILQIPIGARKIRVTKRYKHEGGLHDLVWQGDEWQDRGIDYISDLMFVGLNLRLYPLLVDENGTITDTSVKPDGTSVVSGMRFAEEIPASYEIPVINLNIVVEDSVNVGAENWNTLGKHQFLNTGIDKQLSTNTMKSMLGDGWVVNSNNALKSFVTRIGNDTAYSLYRYVMSDRPDGIKNVLDTNYDQLIEFDLLLGTEGSTLPMLSNDFSEMFFSRDVNGEKRYFSDGTINVAYQGPYGSTYLLQ